MTTIARTTVDTQEDAALGITKETIAVMRKAKNFVFMARPDTDPQPGFRLRLIWEKQAKVPGETTPVQIEYRHDVLLQGAFDHRTYYHEDSRTADFKYAEAHITNYDKDIRSNDDLHTFLSFVRPDDELRIVFYPDGYETVNLKESQSAHSEGRLHCDMLRVHITRNPKRDATGHVTYDTFSFLLAVSIAPANSARMCRTGQWR